MRYSDATAYALHTIVADSVAAWVPAVVQRDTLQDFGMFHPRLLAGRQQRWGHFRVHDGALQLVDVRVSGPP